jgi:hypothetical protein
MMPGPGRERARERAARSRVTSLPGAGDTGKPTLVAFPADGLHDRGLGIVVADVP